MVKLADLLGGTVAVVLVGFGITTVGIFTPGWAKDSGSSFGLFEQCIRIKLSDTEDFYQAVAALEIIAFIVAVVSFLAVFLYVVFAQYGKLTRFIGWFPLIALISSIVAGVFAIIGCIVFAAKVYGSSDPNYSFFLTLFGSIILIIGTALFFQGGKKSSIGGY